MMFVRKWFLVVVSDLIVFDRSDSSVSWRTYSLTAGKFCGFK